MNAAQPEGERALESMAKMEYVIAGPFGDCLLAYYELVSCYPLAKFERKPRKGSYIIQIHKFLLFSVALSII